MARSTSSGNLVLWARIPSWGIFYLRARLTTQGDLSSLARLFCWDVFNKGARFGG